MNILIVNPIVYTSETRNIKRAASIKDNMIYDLCLAFMEKGHEIVFYAAEPYRPVKQESYPFKVIWGKCVLQNICQPYRFPYMSGLPEYIKDHDKEGDQRESLETLSKKLVLSSCVIFTGKMNHDQLLPLLAHAKEMLVNTEKDNSMISIVEAIVVGTPVITTEVPLNASYIKKYHLGIAKNWDHKDLAEVIENNFFYMQNCLNYRNVLSTYSKVDQFIKIHGRGVIHRGTFVKVKRVGAVA